MTLTVITGGAGFIGSHLVNLLLRQGHKVRVIDSLWTGSIESVEKFQPNENFEYIKRDVRDPFPEDETADEIYHLACPASPDLFEEYAIDILETCYRGTKNVLEFALRCNARVLLASTSEIYGEPQVTPQSEKYWGNVNSFGPRSCYDEGKRIAEALAFAYRSKYKLQVRIARIFNCYGPNMQHGDGRAVPNFITAAVEGRSIEIYGDGTSTRCFQFVSDCVDGLAALMGSDYDRPVNIGSDWETKISELAEIVTSVVAEKTGRPIKVPISYLPARQDDPTTRKPDISLAGDILSWKPRVGLQQGLEQATDWFIKHDNRCVPDAKRLLNGTSPLDVPAA